MRNPKPINTPPHPISQPLYRAVLLACLVISFITGCSSTPSDEDIELPTLGNNLMQGPRGVYAVIREADIPLEIPTDEAWAIIDEGVVPPVMRSAWLGNGLRVGILRRDQLDAYEQSMPEVVAFSTAIINQSFHPVPIIETTQLRSDVYFQIDLTRPPLPLRVENITGGENSTLRLLARIETEDDGRHTLVLTPQHYIPSPFDLLPRDPLEKELDGRVYEELAVRLTLAPDQIAVIGLNWPWPIQRVIPELDDQAPPTTTPSVPTTVLQSPIPPTHTDDPAAPPSHINPPQPSRDDQRTEPDSESPGSDETDPQLPPRYERVAPPLPTNFGSTLFTGTRIRQPVRTVLLITIEDPTPADLQDALEPAE